MSAFSDPWQPSGRSTWPDSGNDVEHGYMKLPGKRKMIKIRQTMYEDPGNPFQDELDAERLARGEPESDRNKALPEAPDEVSPTGRSFFELDISYDPFQSPPKARREAGRSLPLERNWPYEPSETSPTSRFLRFDSNATGSAYEPAAGLTHSAPRCSVGQPEAVQVAPRNTRPEHHRSTSLTTSTSPPLSSEFGGEYVSARRFWRRENSLPLMNEVAEERDYVTGPKSARGTRFYGFYEDLMKDYDKRQSKI